MIIFVENNCYCIGYLIGEKHKAIKWFDTYEEARKELHYLNGGTEDVLQDIGTIIYNTRFF